MSKEKITVMTVFLLLVGIVFYASIAVAQPSGPDSANAVSSSTGSISNTAANITAQAGNVTALNIGARTITNAWQGYFGNITGTITLEDAGGNSFYNWSGLGSLSGEVYASRSDNVGWAGINCTNATELSGENSFLGKVASAADSVDNTFNETTHPAFQVGSVSLPVDYCNSTNAYINTGPDANRFHQVLLADGSGNLVYTTLIDEDQTGFNGATSDFQLLVGENGNATQSSTSTAYYFYIELS